MSPIAVALAFFLALFSLRAFDLLVLRVDSWADPTIVSKVIGLLLVLWYVHFLTGRITSVGLHTRNLRYAIGVGALSLLVMFTLLYVIQFHALRVSGETPRIVLGAVDAHGDFVTGALFLSVYLVGQILNAFNEECIFRGVILPQLMSRMSFWRANLVQASLFAVAHLVWPLSSVVLGQATLSQALAQAGALLVFTTIGGFLFGYLYYRTNSLWTAVFAHFFDNSVWLFIHIETSTRVNAETDVSMFARIAFLSLAAIAWFVAKRSNIVPLQPWTPKRAD